MEQYLISTVNFAGLLALTGMSLALGRKWVSSGYLLNLTFGIVLGLGAIIVSLQPIMVVNGLQIDPRNLFVGLAAAFLGPFVGVMTFIVAAATRYYEGAAVANVCIFSLFVAMCAGLVWRRVTRNYKEIELKHLAILGLVISLSYISTFLLPYEYWSTVFFKAIPSLIGINLIGAMVLGGHLKREAQRDLRETELQMQASIDSLTGLLNRRAFKEACLGTALSKSSAGTACMMLDLDHFKRVNDALGHGAGDSVLVSVAGKLRSSLRDSDVAGRVGGEEFAIYLPNASKAQAHMIAERIREAISEINKLGSGFVITGSIGLCWSEVPMEFDTAMLIADRALYRAKRDGRDQVVFGDREESSELLQPNKSDLGRVLHSENA